MSALLKNEHSRLTAAQAEATRELYKDWLRLSKARHEFGRLSRRIGFCPRATKELWEARPAEVKK